MTGKLPINVNHLLRQRTIEGERIEYKAGWNPQRELHTFCAFVNDFHQDTLQVTRQVTLHDKSLIMQDDMWQIAQTTDHVDQFVAALTGGMSRAQPQAALQLRDRRHFTTAYLKSALKVGLDDMTLPDNPNSRQPALATIFQTLISG